MARVFGGADARDLGARAVQRVRNLAGHHVHFIAGGERDDDVGGGRSGGLEHGRIGGIAGDGADVEAILQVAQDLFIGVDHRDLVRFFTRQVVRRGAPDLAGAEYHDLHGGCIVCAVSDGDIDFSKYSVEQLVSIIKCMDPLRYPLNYRNARAVLKEKWPDAPEDLSLATAQAPTVVREPMHVLSDGTRRFAVNFEPPRPAGPGEPAANDQKLGGSGRVDVGPTHVTFTEMRDGAVFRTRQFAMAEIANVEWAPVDGLVVVRTATDDRHVTVWLQLPEEAHLLKELLPSVTTPQFVEQQQLEVDFSERLRVLSPRAFVVQTLIALNVIMFIIMAAAGAGIADTNPEVHVRFGSNYGPLTWTGEPWRLLSSAFLHFGVIHLALNMYALYNGGVLTERLFGSGRFVAIYLIAALAGSVVSGWWDASRNSAGASGAIFGVYGALLAFFAVRRAEIPVRLLKSAGKGALLLCGYSLAIGATSPLIDNACHVGGLLGGAAAGFLLARPLQIQARASKRPGVVAGVCAGLCALLLLLSSSLWMKDGSRHAGAVAGSEIRKFAVVEETVVKRFIEIVSSLDKEKLPAREAGLQIEREVLPPWRAAMPPLLAIDAGKIADEELAGRVRALQRYVKHRDDAMSISAELFKRGRLTTTPELDAAWAGVKTELDFLSGEK